MIRTLTLAAGLAATASAASATLVGFEIREDAALNSAASAVVGQDARVLRLFAIYDGPGTPGPAMAGVPDFNELTGVTNIDVGSITFQLTQGSFFQTPPPFGGDTEPDPAFLPFSPLVQWDTYLAIGGEPADDPTNVRNPNNSVTPDFAFGPDFIIGSWFNSSPGNDFADARPDGAEFSVFAGQFTVVGAGVGGSKIERVNGTYGDEVTGFSELLQANIMMGGLTAGQGAPIVIHLVPTPGALALFGLSGLAAVRRRRGA